MIYGMFLAFRMPGFMFKALMGVLVVCLHTRHALAQVELPDLPYAEDALEPWISQETVSFHYGKHHAGYVTNANSFIEADPSLQGLPLWKLIKRTEGSIFNNIAQVYNHNLYWNSMSPDGGGEPTGVLLEAIEDAFGTFADFKDYFTSAATGHFGSGWAWLILTDDDTLDVVDSSDAENPISEGFGVPLLTCDVWEHAYYLDYQNLRATYVDGFWEVVNWDYASSKYTRLLNIRATRRI